MTVFPVIVGVNILVTLGRHAFSDSLGDNVKASGKKLDYLKGHKKYVQEMLNIHQLSRGFVRSVGSRLAGVGGGVGSDT